MKRRLWQILGPVLCACILVFGALLLPLRFGAPSAREVHSAAVSLNRDVLSGERMKKAAVRRGYVPFIGSSELSRMDPFHPSVLAQKYHRNYNTLLLGDPGTQDLSQFVDNQSLLGKLRGKKVVFIISPQWFTAGGQRSDAFAYYYSPLEMSGWLLHKRGGLADRYAARRILAMGNTKGAVHAALLSVAAGQKLSWPVRTQLRAQHQLLLNEDNLFSRTLHSGRPAKITRAAAKLPAHATDAQLAKLADKMGRRCSRNNPFGINDGFFRKRLYGRKLARLAGSQQNFDYRRSPEYSDLELLLHEFARNRINVQFIIPPVNARWADYTGLPRDMMTETASKIKYQLRSQGFDHILDMTTDAKKSAYMEDTIHLGWRGWVAVDKTVHPFLERKLPAPHYHLQNRFYTHKWQQTVMGANHE
ncbi:D-alanyl-lipoteichoic acid biosynthesis protein DltD [Lacticaseibacillus zhaodongensis]|uniref:D-alanyl-lipoteichoic acid biosynthesis protein DltD n=1 Tax=Lacticaseibacillus zhaodongensis TaxID=2668065 RepID=UPI0012D2BA1A|nr:D-alanyl-lipoteichoic acid biosynthesis protein DltD [Lacticaseibacillus zhaodongensis]